MSDVTINLNAETYAYLQNVSLREAKVLEQLRHETHEGRQGRMQISPEQGQFMGLIVEMLGAKKTIDIGTFTGYSALVVALSLPEDGKVITCDINKECTQMAKRYWEMAGVSQKIILELRPALQTLDQLIEAGKENTFDFIFIDADKRNYDAYYEKSLSLLRVGGLIAIDNVLWSGRVADPFDQDKDTISIRELNLKLLTDERITLSMLPIGDGLTLARKNEK